MQIGVLYTDEKQSRRLVDIGLDPNTADAMIYQTPQDLTDPKNGYAEYGVLPITYGNFEETKARMLSVYQGYIDNDGIVPTYFIPSWSICKLLDLIPKPLPYNHDDHCLVYPVMHIDSKYIHFGSGLAQVGPDFEGENYLEAAYSVMEWLLENNYIEKTTKD